MNRFVASALIALLPLSLHADDLHPYNWTGLYIGGDAGAFWNRASLSDGEGWVSDDAGFIGGGRVGYNLQIGQFLMSVEGEANIATLDNSKPCPGIAGSNCEIKQDTLDSARIRLGVVPEARSVIYMTGGVAFSDYRFNASIPGSQSSGTGVAMGKVIGIGVDHAFSDHWSYGAEFSYYKFGKSIGTGSSSLAAFADNVLVARLGYQF